MHRSLFGHLRTRGQRAFAEAWPISSVSPSNVPGGPVLPKVSCNRYCISKISIVVVVLKVTPKLR